MIPSLDQLRVRAGQRVKDAWDRLVRYLESIRLLPGPGILLRWTPRGVIVSARIPPADFTGHFAVQLAEDRIRIGFGLVNDIEPTINGRPITGTEGEEAPELRLSESKFDDAGYSWICIEVVIDPESGEILETEGASSSVRVIQTKTRYPDEDAGGNVGWKAVALLYRGQQTEGFGRLEQITYFSQEHYTARRAARWVHFFGPAS